MLQEKRGGWEENREQPQGYPQEVFQMSMLWQGWFWVVSNIPAPGTGS